ncbi:hypothetical protein KY290_013019 [Solanum tuberosum]|uniref:Uncharacterized protein n=1 Tax=Solanum tuberosum TaxID=4113 RepID=A0ABQ7VKM3_SOLTU|nr:hypothetical protein KY285_012783 [Solanum tuberosum]KAH0769038.1 hypothetical protein KY290_013019 [Solanum tuberosum]
MANIKERMVSVEGRLSGTDERLNTHSNRVPQSQHNPIVYPSLCKDSYVGTSLMKGGTQVPSKEPTIKGVMDALMGCSNIQGKKDLSCGRQDDKITPSDVPSGVKLESSIDLDSYTCYSNPLWCEAFPPKNGNLFLEDESTLVGKECDEEEGGVGLPITSSSWCVSLLDSMTNAFEPIGSHTHENTLEEVDLRDTFLYYLFTYDEAHDVEWIILFEGKSANLVNGCALDPSTWLAFPFDPVVS